jgi:hypothetical protein
MSDLKELPVEGVRFGYSGELLLKTLFDSYDRNIRED